MNARRRGFTLVELMVVIRAVSRSPDLDTGRTEGLPAVPLRRRETCP